MNNTFKMNIKYRTRTNATPSKDAIYRVSSNPLVSNEQYSVKHRSSVEWQSLPPSGGRKRGCKDAIYRVSVKLCELCASVLKRETNATPSKDAIYRVSANPLISNPLVSKKKSYV
jgi:hypothetical protein